MDLTKVKKLENVAKLEVEVVRDLAGCETKLLLNDKIVNTTQVLKALYPDVVYVDKFYQNKCITDYYEQSLENYAYFKMKLLIGEIETTVSLELEEYKAGEEHEVITKRLQSLVNHIDNIIDGFQEFRYTKPLILK